MLSKYTQPIIIGKAITIADNKKGKNAPSLITLTKRRGIQPTGEVFLIMKLIVNSAVKRIVLNVNLSFYCK